MAQHRKIAKALRPSDRNGKLLRNGNGSPGINERVDGVAGFVSQASRGDLGQLGPEGGTDDNARAWESLTN